MTKYINRRILLVDDNPEIHRDFRAILVPETASGQALEDAEAALFGASTRARATRADGFSIESADSGRAAVERVENAAKEKKPFALAFVDMRMPPGWDGVETIERLWKIDSDLQVVVCTAYSDYSWSDMVSRLGATDGLLVLKKPFDPIEVCQLATALTSKWSSTQRERAQLAEVKRAELEARAYAASLETVNRALESARATAEAEIESRRQLLLHIASQLARDAAQVERSIASSSAQPAAALPATESAQVLAHRLTANLGAVRDLAELETGSLRARLEPCSPSEIASRALEAARAYADPRHVALSQENSTDPQLRVVSDPTWIARVLVEVLHTVIERSRRGPVRLAVGSEVHDAKERVARFSVWSEDDTAPRESLAELFDPLPAAASSQRTSRASILGLNVARRLAQKLGGNLALETATCGAPCWVLTLPSAPTIERASVLS